MVKLEAYRQCLWRNMHAPGPVLTGTVVLGDAFGWTTEKLSPPARSVFHEKVPGVLPPSGSLDAAALVVRLAQHIQRLADVAPDLCGVASRDEAARTALVFFSCMDFIIAPPCLSVAVQIVDRLTQSDVRPEHLAKLFKSCSDMLKARGLESRTVEMIEAAARRGIPWLRASAIVRHVQLGQGFRQQRMWHTLFGTESLFGNDYSRNKLLTMNLLQQIRLPVGRFAPVTDAESALRTAAEIGYPLVLKPVDGSKGDSVYVHLRDESELRAALAAVRIHERPYLLQSFFRGEDYRLLVVAGELITTVHRIPASVIGDGRHTIAELVPIANVDPRRITNQNAVPIVLDEESDRFLARQGLSRSSVPADGQVVRVKATANVATGGTTRVIDGIHPDNVQAAIRAAKAIGLIIAGVDLITPDISKSWHEVGGGICEVNAAVGLTHPNATTIDVRGKLIEAFYPPGDDGRIPTAMVTGTMGKTSTCMMLASILSSSGHMVGCASTEGVRIGAEVVERGDLAGADGASIVLRDATVTAAVLETARGGLVKVGMYLDRCDVAALVNVEREQIEIDGIETLADMAALKRKVLDAARKAVVLNADDPSCLAMAPEFVSSIRTIFFSSSPDSPAICEHRARGGDVVFLERCDGRETITAASGSRAVPMLETASIPATEDGLIWPHAINAAAATALAIGMSIDLDTIAEGLRRYGREYPSAEFRMVFADGFPMRVMFDSSGKAPAYAAAVAVTGAVPVTGKRICSVTIPGNRPDWAFTESASALAGHFQHYICFELAQYRRGRQPGEIAARMADALVAAGVDRAHVSLAQGHKESAKIVAHQAQKDDFVIVFGVDSPAIVEEYRAAFREKPDRA